MKALSIGAAAKQAGCSVPTVRYYEDIGLLPPARRTAAGQRSYGEADLRRLGFIRRCRELGFAVDQVRSFIELLDQPQRPCGEARDIAAAQLRAVRLKRAELAALEASLAAFVQGCDSGCAGGAAVDCSLLDDLARPSGPAPRCCPAVTAPPP